MSFGFMPLTFNGTALITTPLTKVDIRSRAGATREHKKMAAFNLFTVLVAATMVGNAAAATYVVGDSLGWTVPNNTSDYTNWAAQHVFRVGDVLVFNFTTGAHDVAEMSKAAFDSCSSTSPTLLVTVGPWITTLTSAGEKYYICTFGSHCSLGQKLAINVSASSASPAPAPAPSSPIAPTPSPTPSPAPPTPMPSPGSAPSTTPTPIPSGGASPGPSPSPLEPSPPESLSPSAPPPPSGAALSTISASLLGFAFVIIGLAV